MKLVILIAAVLLSSCGSRNKLVRDCIKCGFGVEADLCAIRSISCDKPYDRANCDAGCHYEDKCPAYCYSVTELNADGSSQVECCSMPPVKKAK